MNKKIQNREEIIFFSNLREFITASVMLLLFLDYAIKTYEKAPENLNIALTVLICDFILLLFFSIQCFCSTICIAIKKKRGNISLEYMFNIFEIGYFFTWIILSLIYASFALYFEKEFKLKSFIYVMGWIGTTFYLISAGFLCVANLIFCRKILNNKKISLLLVISIRSIITALMTWFLIIIYIYNNISNKKVPGNILINYITWDTVLSFLYPLLDQYKYTLEEVEKSKKEKQEKKSVSKILKLIKKTLSRQN